MLSTESHTTTTATTRIPQETVPCRGDSEIRERLLNKLGIFFGGHTPCTVSYSSSSSLYGSPSCSPSIKSKTGNCHSGNPLPPSPADRSRSNSSDDSQPSMVTDSDNSNPEEYEEEAGSSSLIDYSTQTRESLKLEQHLLYQKEKKLQFFPLVDVVHIPSHRDYSPQDHDRLWNSSQNTQTQLERNVVEFIADDCNWRKATEEGSFIAADGHLHHPATFPTVQLERTTEAKTAGTPTTETWTSSTSPADISTPKRRKTKKGHKRKKRRGNNISGKNTQKKPGDTRSNGRRRAVRALSNGPAAGVASLTRFADT